MLPPKSFGTVYPENIPTGAKADILLANILSGPLTELAPSLTSLIKPGGDIVLSGILNDQTEAVIAAYQPWFAMDPPVLKEGWVRLTGKKHSATL